MERCNPASTAGRGCCATGGYTTSAGGARARARAPRRKGAAATAATRSDIVCLRSERSVKSAWGGERAKARRDVPRARYVDYAGDRGGRYESVMRIFFVIDSHPTVDGNYAPPARRIVAERNRFRRGNRRSARSFTRLRIDEISPSLVNSPSFTARCFLLCFLVFPRVDDDIFN